MASFNGIVNPLTSVIVAALLTAACADKAAIREERLAQYEALESARIDAVEAEEIRRKNQMRVASRLRQMEAETAINAQERRAQALDGTERLENQAGEQSAIVNASPVVTQVVIGTQARGEDVPLWTSQDYPSPLDGSPLCAVVSEPSVIRNGELDTRVSVIITADSVFLRTDATFDASAPETGFRIDSGIPVAFDGFLNELTAVVNSGYPRLISAIESGSTLIVSFAYSPQLSSAETHVLELSLADVTEPLAQLEACSTQKEDVSSDS